MIKMGGKTKSGNKFVLLGISDMNIEKMREKKPIVLYGAEVDVPELELLVICWGENEDALAKELNDYIGPETRVRDHRQEKKN